MQLRIQILAVVLLLGLILVVIELVRRRKLMERYAIVWLTAGIALLLLSVFNGVIDAVALAIGIYYPPSALFIVAFGFVSLVLLHFSTVVSSLTDQNKILAQRLALMEKRVRELHDAAAALAEEGEAAEADRRGTTGEWRAASTEEAAAATLAPDQHRRRPRHEAAGVGARAPR
jgi:hypothetical protein